MSPVRVRPPQLLVLPAAGVVVMLHGSSNPASVALPFLNLLSLTSMRAPKRPEVKEPKFELLADDVDPKADKFFIVTENGEAENMAELLDQIEAAARGFAFVPTDEEGRKRLASLAYTVSRTKTALDAAGKDKATLLKNEIAKIKTCQDLAKERLDKLRDEIRKPVTDFENAEKTRIDAHEKRIATLKEEANIPIGTTLADLERRLKFFEDFNARTLEEFAEAGATILDSAIPQVKQAIVVAKETIAKDKELEELRAMVANQSAPDPPAAAATPEETKATTPAAAAESVVLYGESEVGGAAMQMAHTSMMEAVPELGDEVASHIILAIVKRKVTGVRFVK